MKYQIKKQNDYARIKEDRLKQIELADEKLWKCSHEYKSNDKKIIYIDYLELNNLSLLNDVKITQYFIGSTYGWISLNYKNTKALLLIVGYNSQYYMIELFCIVLLCDENSKLLIELYDHIKNVYKFNPKLITYDFALSNIQAINIVFKSLEIGIIPYFFYLV